MKLPVKNLVIGLVAFTLFYFGTTYFLKIKKNSTTTDSQKTADQVVDYLTKDEWVDFNSVEGNFNMVFPKYPQSQTSDVDGPNDIKIKFTQYASVDNDKNSYMAQVAEYSNLDPKTFDVRKGLEGAVNGSTASSPSNKLVRSNFETISGNPGVTATIYNSDEKIYLNMRNFFKGARMYSLIATSPEDKITANIQKFFDSFTITQ